MSERYCRYIDSACLTEAKREYYTADIGAELPLWVPNPARPIIFDHLYIPSRREAKEIIRPNIVETVLRRHDLRMEENQGSVVTVLFGQSGAGKTKTAEALVNELINAGLDPVHFKADANIRVMKAEGYPQDVKTWGLRESDDLDIRNLSQLEDMWIGHGLAGRPIVVEYVWGSIMGNHFLRSLLVQNRLSKDKYARNLLIGFAPTPEVVDDAENVRKKLYSQANFLNQLPATRVGAPPGMATYFKTSLTEGGKALLDISNFRENIEASQFITSMQLPDMFSSLSTDQICDLGYTLTQLWGLFAPFILYDPRAAIDWGHWGSSRYGFFVVNHYSEKLK